MAERGVLSRELLAIARDVGDDRELAGLICRACVTGTGVDGAALSLLTASTARHTLHATDAVAELLEELQFSLNEGACIEAATTGDPVWVADVRAEGAGTRWPMFAAAVIERTPVRALFALPLRWGTVNLGVIDLYRITPGAVPAQVRRDLAAAMDIAALMMLTLRTEPEPDPAGDPGGLAGGWLDPVVSARAEIHQATGMVSAQLNTDTATALARIRAHAFTEQRLLIDVAFDVVARRVSFSKEMS